MNVSGTINGLTVYAKGTMYLKCFDPATNDLVFYSNKIVTNQLQSTVNLGAINAGIGNPVVIQIPDTPSLTQTITAGDFSLQGRALSVGSTVTYNGVVPVDEAVAATGTTLTVGQTPCAPLGGCDIVCTINNDSTAYLIDAESMQVQGFTATEGTTYCVHYYTQSANAMQMSVDTLMSPAVVRSLYTIPLYATEPGQGAINKGSHIGNCYITVPRMQFNGDVSTEGSQTTAATTNLTGTALSYNEACDAGIQCGSSASPKLAYMVVEIFGNPDQFVESLAVVGGNELDVAYDEGTTIPVKYVMPDGSLVTPLMSNLTFAVADGSTQYISVSPLGVVTGLSNGMGTVNITSNYNADLTTSVQCTVTGAPTPPTENVTFALTTPSAGGSNTIEGGGASMTVTVNVENSTSSVVLTATKTAAQSVEIGGTDSGDVSAGGTETNPTYTVNTTSVSSAGGSKSFTLTVSESNKTSITYNVTVTVAGS